MDFRLFQNEDYEKYIRDITKTHMEPLFKENFGGWSDSVSEKKFFEVVKTGFVYLGFIKDEFIGYVAFHEEKKNPNSYLLSDIHMSDAYQGKKYGCQILHFAEEKIKQLKGNQLKVFVFFNNPAIEFYKKSNFAQTEKSQHTSILIKELVPN